MLAEMFPPGSFDEAIDGVVGIVVFGLDAFVFEKDRLLRIIPDVGDISRRVIGIMQVLRPAIRIWRPQAIFAGII